MFRSTRNVECRVCKNTNYFDFGMTWKRSNQTFEEHKPSEVRLNKKEKALYLTFEDGRQFRYPAEFLRVESPSAEVQGHGFEKRIVFGKMNVAINNIEAVGNYAIRIIFSDTHDSGIYSWNYLHKLGTNKYSMMKDYLKKLKQIKRHRDPNYSKRSSIK
eukprot:TRINITY_DN5063_c0_g1_i2.p1 TRINITY_DN5063_c0_g1~~TRINITY_DN5063_c0_g1_i2.p1  ORF type:complete len:159 (+),score=25.30 TRINITY_DN5063_c0_g1_i2:1-477(+)